MKIEPHRLLVDIGIAVGIFLILSLRATGQIAATILVMMPLIFLFFAGHDRRP